MIQIYFPVKKSFREGEGLVYEKAVKQKNKQEKDILELRPGYIYYFQGKNGIGKTTLLNIISFLTDFDGSTYINGDKIVIGQTDESVKKTDSKNEIRSQYFSYIFQDPHIINIYTIKENLRILNPNIDIEDDLGFISDKISELDIEEKEKDYLRDKLNKIISEKDNSPFYLSGGEKQLLSFIRAMIKPSNVIFADEPWASMDIMLKEFIEEELYKYLTNDDIFKQIRNKTKKNKLTQKNTVVGIAHKFHHEKEDDRYGNKDVKWHHKISIKKLNSRRKNHHLNLTRYATN